MSIITVGIDLAKNVFAVPGVNASGKPERVKPRVLRDLLLTLISSLPPRIITIAACSDAHQWARYHVAWIREATHHQ